MLAKDLATIVSQSHTKLYMDLFFWLKKLSKIKVVGLQAFLIHRHYTFDIGLNHLLQFEASEPNLKHSIGRKNSFFFKTNF